MKKLWNYLKLHWAEDFSFRAYIPIVGLLILLLTINYKLDFEDTVLDTRTGLLKFFTYFVFYAIPYYAVIVLSFFRDRRIWRDPVFYAKTILGLVILSLDSSLPFIRNLLSSVDSQIYLWVYKVAVNSISLFTVLLPLYIYYRSKDKTPSSFYGLGQTHFDARPYVVMLLIMLPLLLFATTQASFLRQYPMYKSTSAHEYLNVPEWVTVMIYEFAYGADFLTVELLFRGFFVIGMITVLGRRSVLAMAVIYCMLHFGKPAGEAVSSIFGGYILGVIAYETRSIWGGVIVHLGIAWMMEIISYIAKQL